MGRTLSIVKPDGVARGVIGEVVKRLETNGLNIIAMKMIHMTKALAEGFYAVHRQRPFFGSLTDFTNGITKTTNPPPPPSKSGWSGGGGSSCACACAGCACACACAGGGR